MKKVKISVTEASRNFADCINRARYQNVTFVLLKNGSPVARLTPDKGNKVCLGRQLAEAMAEIELPNAEVKEWHSDLSAAREALESPVFL